MKSNRRYIASSLGVQMVVIPIILTVGLFAVSFTLGGWLNTASSVLGKNAERFIITMIAFFGSLTVGGITGFVFGKSSGIEKYSVKIRYITAIVPIIYALIFAVLALILSKGNYNSSWWAVYVFKNPIFLVFDFALAFIGLHFIMPVAELMSYLGFLFGIFIWEKIYQSNSQNKLSVVSKSVFTSVCVVVIIFLGISTKDVLNNGVIELLYGKSTVGKDLTEFDLMQIAPFKENNGLARLDKESSLKFKDIDEMPRLDGATAAYPVYAAFVEAVYEGLGDYYKANMNSNQKDVYLAFVESDSYPFNIVKCSKTNIAYERLMNGQTDIIFAAEPSKSQVEALKAKGDEFVLTPIGSEAFVFFTNVKNPVDNLSIEQIQDIYSGSITNWKEVGGQNKSILPYQRPENSGSQTIMQNRVMKDVKLVEPTKESFSGGMGDIIVQVASYKNAKNAIGYSFMYYSSSMVKNNQIKYVGINGVKPTHETVRNKTYPFTVPVYAVTLKSNSNKNVSKFIDWILSEEGQSLVEKTGYTPMLKK